MKTKVKVILSSYITVFIIVVILSLFPGYNDLFSEPVKSVPVGQFYYTIASLLNGNFVIDIGDGEYFYTSSQSIISGLASLLFLALFFIYAVLLVVLTIKRNKVLPVSPSFVFMFIAHIPTMTVKIQLDSTFIASSHRFDITIGVIALVALLIDLARLAIWLYRKYPPKPRPRKPSSKERVAELEARVKELENKKNG